MKPALATEKLAELDHVMARNWAAKPANGAGTFPAKKLAVKPAKQINSDIGDVIAAADGAT